MSAKPGNKAKTMAKKSNKPTDTDDKHADLKFEEAMEALEEVVQKLEAGDVPLEESLAAFERGVGLVRTLHARLDGLQEKIEQLTTGDRGDAATELRELDND
jgi:exodeoxyribonuclease VII small subunit